jgi:hypothetical protein
MAGRLGIEKTAMIRARAGLGYALAEAMNEGHCGLPRAVADDGLMATTIFPSRSWKEARKLGAFTLPTTRPAASRSAHLNRRSSCS